MITEKDRSRLLKIAHGDEDILQDALLRVFTRFRRIEFGLVAKSIRYGQLESARARREDSAAVKSRNNKMIAFRGATYSSISEAAASTGCARDTVRKYGREIK